MEEERNHRKKKNQRERKGDRDSERAKGRKEMRIDIGGKEGG